MLHNFAFSFTLIFIIRSDRHHLVSLEVGAWFESFGLVAFPLVLVFEELSTLVSILPRILILSIEASQPYA